MSDQSNISTNGTKDIPSTGSVQETPMNDIRDDDTLKDKIERAVDANPEGGNRPKGIPDNNNS